MNILGFKIKKRQNEIGKKNRVLFVMLHIFILDFVILNREIHSALKLHEDREDSFQKPKGLNSTSMIYTSGTHHVQNNTKLKQKGQTESDNHLITNVKLGKWLGSGASSDTFRAVFDKPRKKKYIIKLTSDYNNKRYAKLSIRQVEAMKRLSPHPSIPEILYFAESIPNPFRENLFQMPSKNTNEEYYANVGVQDLNTERLRLAKNMSVIIMEEVQATHHHMKDYSQELILPAEKIRCFFYRYFETLAYAHSRNVILIDTKFWNIMLQDGVLKIFDWNLAEVVETKKQKELRTGKKPFFMCSEEEEDCDVRYDVNKVAEDQLSKFLRHDKRKSLLANKENALSKVDHDLLREMRNLMRLEGNKTYSDLPSFRWLLDNHEYFQVERSENCSLQWD